MEDKFNDFFSKTDFDIKSPHAGHLERFQNKLKANKSKKSISWKWMSAAASIVLLLGFSLGSYHEKKQYNLADVSPKMQEVQSYFVATINQELKEIEATRSLETESIIEHALEELEELEETFQVFVKDLKNKANQKRIIAAMIDNYQQRLQVLENVMQQIENIKNSKTLQDAIII